MDAETGGLELSERILTILHESTIHDFAWKIHIIFCSTPTYTCTKKKKLPRKNLKSHGPQMTNATTPI